MIEVRIRNNTYQFPSGWNELTRKQLVYIARLLRNNLSREVIEVFWLQYITGIPVKRLADIIDPAAFLDFHNATEWIFSGVELTEQKIPVLRIGWKKLLGPERGLGNMTVEQFFGYTELAMQEYIETEEKEMLDWLIASLYVFPEHGKYVFRAENVEKVKKLIEKIDNDRKYAIFLFYLGCRNHIVQQYSDLFSGENENEEYDFLKMLAELNQGDVTKNEQLKRTNLYEMLEHLRVQKEIAENLKKQEANG